MADRQTVVLVDGSGAVLGSAAKRTAHEPPGSRHLAFSVFLFSEDGLLLLQQRASSKYHFAGIWANSCCSHPAPGEELIASAELRVAEELGITRAAGSTDGRRANAAGAGDGLLVATLREVGIFEYRAVDEASGLVEHEVDHVLVGRLACSAGDDPVSALQAAVDPGEVDAVRWARPADLRQPAPGFAPWFAPALEIALSGLDG